MWTSIVLNFSSLPFHLLYKHGIDSSLLIHAFYVKMKRYFHIQSTLVILNSKGLSEIFRDIRTSTYQICKTEEKIIRTTTFNIYICNWTLEVIDILKILWKRGEIAISPLFHNIFYLLLDVPI